jgi:hypothetical protein
MGILAALLRKALSLMPFRKHVDGVRQRYDETPKIPSTTKRNKARSIAKVSPKPLEGDQYVQDFPDEDQK